MSTLRIVTVTPGSAAEGVSVTVPCRVPVTVWASRGGHHAPTATIVRAVAMRWRIPKGRVALLNMA